MHGRHICLKSTDLGYRSRGGEIYVEKEFSNSIRRFAH